MDYRKYKWFYTRSGKLVVGGKSAEQNDSLLRELKKTKKEYIVMHTKTPGSPFCAIIAPISAVSKKDIEECAIFTGCFSRAWKEKQKITEVHEFKISQLKKEGSLKTGTWQVSGKIINHRVSLELALTKQEGFLRAVPLQSAITNEVIVYIRPGNVDKVEAIAKNKIAALKELNKEQLIAALPAGGVLFTKNE